MLVEFTLQFGQRESTAVAILAIIIIIVSLKSIKLGCLGTLLIN